MSANILALDTSTENCSVALLTDNNLYTRCALAPRDHTKLVLPMVDEVLREAGLKLADVDALAFGRGPGSFTGVRIGIGIAQGLAFGADLPMIGISTLAAMAQATYRQHGAERAVCAIDARMSEVYWGQYLRQENGDWQLVGEECVIPPAELAEQIAADGERWAQAGTGWGAYSEQLAALKLATEPTDVLYPSAEDIVFLARYRWQAGETVSAEESSPVYLRDKVAWKKLPGRE